MIKNILYKIYGLPTEAVKISIRVYQKLFSFDHAFWASPEKMRICIHEPSCSEYTYQAVDRHGAVKGSVMGTARILRCNPMSKGGYDPVPKKFSLKPSKV